MGKAGDDEDLTDRLIGKAAAAAEQRDAAAHEHREREAAAARAAQAAARERLLSPEPEIERMRKLGRAFAEAVSGRPYVQSMRAGTRPQKILVATEATGRKRKQRGWNLNQRDHSRAGSPWMVVLDDGRVGVEAWTKCYSSMGGLPNTYEHHEWQDLPWSAELEDLLVTWLANHGVTHR